MYTVYIYSIYNIKKYKNKCKIKICVQYIEKLIYI